MTTLKERTVSGLIWSCIDNFAKHGITLIVGIILARLLTPREFGLIGMTTVFIVVSQSFIDSGFTEALIRKKDCTHVDFSTVFYFNLLVGILFFLILFFSAQAISSFFGETQLKPILQVLGIGLIFNALTIIQRAKLTKRLDFRIQTKISIFSGAVAGVIGIVMAYFGYGVWSLVMQTLAAISITTMLLWLWNKWRPSLVFSWSSFREMFSFGSKLLISGLINTAHRNIYLLIIGKYFTATELGYYTRADHFKKFPSQNITNVIQRVSFPVLSSIQGDIPRLRSAYQKLIKSIMLLTFIAMLVLAAVAKPLVLTLIGEKWLPSVIYLQLLCFVGMLHPLHAINLNMLKVQGRSDLFLKLEIIKTILTIPVIVIGVLLGIKIMIIGMIVSSMIAYFLNSYYSGRHIGYSCFRQLFDILPFFFQAVIISGIVFILGMLLKTPVPVSLALQLLTAAALSLGIFEFMKIESYVFIKRSLLMKVLGARNENKQ